MITGKGAKGNTDMIVGVPCEVKPDEFRVGMRLVGVELLTRRGHQVLVQSGAGVGAGFPDEGYVAAGSEIVPRAEDVWERADLVVKVKEPQLPEIPMIRDGQTVFTYFHFASDRELTIGCIESGCIAVAYETLTDSRGRLPLLTPMSEIAGKLAIQEGADYLENPHGGRGVLLGGVPGVEPAHVLIIGGGVVGTCAARIAAGMGAHVIILDISLDRLRELEETMPPNVDTVYSDPHAIQDLLPWADLIVGAVLIPGAKAPSLITRRDLAQMKTGSVIVDVAIDQGGCVETSRMTTHSDPVYTVDGVVHYCVGNMPGAVARTATLALTNATLPWVLKLAEHGPDILGRMDLNFANAINMNRGTLTNQPVAEAHGLEFEPLVAAS
jgi:alanine dehydrogenase